MKEKWDERYSNEQYIYGVEPNVFFKEFLLKQTKKGKNLLPAEGEGRNAVFAAQQGFDVYAFDYSVEAKKKAEKLANLNHVTINYDVCNIEDFQSAEKFDYIGLFFVHLPEPFRTSFFRNLTNFLAKDGIIFGEVFSKEQINNQTGGPPSLSLLYSKAEIEEIFVNKPFDALLQIQTTLNEGLLHQGIASVIRFILV
ncbi:MAG: methyltransferase domain-containing protein [Bacteroidales bacterium]|nr:methyltransferase domain-containing protein [Bacteroidales bacterium]